MKEPDKLYEDSNAIHEYQEQERLSGTREGESQDIDKKIEDKINSSQWNYIYKLKWIQLTLELISPLIIGLWGLGVLGIYVFNV